MVDDAALTAQVGQAAAALRALAARLAAHGLGARWEGPARRACEVQLRALEENLRTHARQLDALVASRGVTRW